MLKSTTELWHMNRLGLVSWFSQTRLSVIISGLWAVSENMAMFYMTAIIHCYIACIGIAAHWLDSVLYQSPPMVTPRASIHTVRMTTVLKCNCWANVQFSIGNLKTQCVCLSLVWFARDIHVMYPHILGLSVIWTICTTVALALEFDLFQGNE